MSQDSDDETGIPERWEAQLRKGVLDLAILALVARGRCYGLEIQRELEERHGLAVGEGTLYPLLNRLHRAGWLIADWEHDEAAHSRKYYRLTPEGRAELRARARAWTTLNRRLQNLIEPHG